MEDNIANMEERIKINPLAFFLHKLLHPNKVVSDEFLSSSNTLSNRKKRRRVFKGERRREGPYPGTYVVQCVKCMKWRRVPDKETYEEIRENVRMEPFVCKRATAWKDGMSCEEEEEEEISSIEEKREWMMDKGGIPRAPAGWERIVQLRKYSTKKIADVYYITPCSAKLRSLPELKKFLECNPHYVVDHGLSLSNFSFQCPRPLLGASLQDPPSHDPENDSRLLLKEI